VYAFFNLCFCPFHVYESWHNLNVKILVCRIIGPVSSRRVCRTCSYIRRSSGVQAVLRLNTTCWVLSIFSCNLSALFPLFCYAVRSYLDNRILCFGSKTMPQQQSLVIHHLQTGFHEDGTSDLWTGNNHWELCVWTAFKWHGSVEQIHSSREQLVEQCTGALSWRINTASDNFPRRFGLMTSRKLNISSA